MTLCPEVADLWEPHEIPGRDAFAADWRLDDLTASGLPGAVRLGAGKLYADGALTTRTAALTAPYDDLPGTGMLIHSHGRLAGYVDALHRGGWQIATHAIGDRAVAEVMRCYEEVGQDPAARPARRHRIEHAMLVDKRLIERMRGAGVVAVMQPEFIARLGDAYILALGHERAAALNPVRSLLDAGLNIAFSSDCPVVPGAPLDGIRAAVARRTPSGAGLDPQEACTAEEALRAYTVGAARAVHDEGAVGRIAPGMRADMTFLTQHPLDDGLDGTEVAGTMVGGTFVFTADVIGAGLAA
jgi:predicted amidohydrolase YtcJ